MSLLALSRRTGESVVIAHAGQFMRVEIVKVDRGKVRLAFHADADFKIDREEVVQRREQWSAEPGPEEAAALDELLRGKKSPM